MCYKIIRFFKIQFFRCYVMLRTLQCKYVRITTQLRRDFWILKSWVELSLNHYLPSCPGRGGVNSTQLLIRPHEQFKNLTSVIDLLRPFPVFFFKMCSEIIRFFKVQFYRCYGMYPNGTEMAYPACTQPVVADTVRDSWQQ